MLTHSPPLSPNERAAFDRLAQSADTRVLSRRSATEQLIEAGFVAPAAHDLIEQLLLKGYLTETDKILRLTDDREECSDERFSQ